ncbi:hypothetical protein YC2023_043036 [Brassica napus]|uniref:(rape) hypothetical protein n=1 Tax=Brassica napus TaxID=3708 RepID=A0A816IMW7_BRANA|nr:unnamed protein product [Brassica napus]
MACASLVLGGVIKSSMSVAASAFHLLCLYILRLFWVRAENLRAQSVVRRPWFVTKSIFVRVGFVKNCVVGFLYVLRLLMRKCRI